MEYNISNDKKCDIEQNWSNPFVDLPSKPYCLICAAAGPGTVELPDGTITTAAQVKRDLQYTQLFAWNAEKKELREFIEYIRENPDYKGRLVVDSGAYSAWSRGKDFDIDEYIDYLNNSGAIDVAFWVAEADVIPGSMGVDPTEEERAAAPEKSWQNYLYMLDRVKWPKKVVPIFHQGEDFKHLRRMLEYTFPDGDHIPYIGISPRNDVHMNERIAWYDQVWKIIKESPNPDVLTHNFGMTNISVMEQYPSYSSDSTTWLRSGAFGNIQLVVDGSLKTFYVSDRNPDAYNHIEKASPAVKEEVEKVCKRIGHGYSIKALCDAASPYLAQIFNLYVLSDWANNFEFKGNNMFKNNLW